MRRATRPLRCVHQHHSPIARMVPNRSSHVKRIHFRSLRAAPTRIAITLRRAPPLASRSGVVSARTSPTAPWMRSVARAISATHQRSRTAPARGGRSANWVVEAMMIAMQDRCAATICDVGPNAAKTRMVVPSSSAASRALALGVPVSVIPFAMTRVAVSLGRATTASVSALSLPLEGWRLLVAGCRGVDVARPATGWCRG